MLYSRENIVKDILVKLGNNMIDVQLDFNTINTNIDLAIRKYRQRSSNSVEEAYAFLTLQPDVTEYTLPEETEMVRKIFRRRFGVANVSDSDSYTGEQFDPFSLSFANIFLLEAGSMGGLLTYELYNQYLNTASTLFGGNINFSWNTRNKKLQIIRTPRDHEEVLLWVYKTMSESELLSDNATNMWIFECSLAYSKESLGNAMEQYGQLAGPNGGITLNGSQLKAEAKETLDRLEHEIQTYGDGALMPIVGIYG